MDLEQLKNAYRTMCLIRAFEQRMNDIFLQGLVSGTTHLCIGQQACAVGVSEALEAEDCIFSNLRGHGHLIARGADIRRVMAEIIAHEDGYAGGRGGSQHMAIKDINFMGTHGITAGTIPLATGVALHKKLKQEAGMGVVYFGDGAVGEGVFHESLNMASIWKLPVLYVCENNQYAMSTAHESVSPVDYVVDRASAYNMNNARVDGNDLNAVYKTAVEARKSIVNGEGPFLLELTTFRVSGHSRGDKCFYRSREEEAEWAAKDPIQRVYQLLVEAGAISETEDRALQDAISQEITEAESQLGIGGSHA